MIPDRFHIVPDCTQEHRRAESLQTQICNDRKRLCMLRAANTRGTQAEKIAEARAFLRASQHALRRLHELGSDIEAPLCVGYDVPL